MGISFQKYDPTGSIFEVSDDKDYALKTIECGTDEARFQRAMYEVRVMESLKGSPEVVRICDHKVVDNNGERTVYILEEYYETMEKFLAVNEVNASQVLRMVMDVCRALECCHEIEDVLHLDVQAKNIFIDRVGHAKIGNFEYALFREDAGSLESGRGTFPYVAPEVQEGRKCSEQTDIYAVGQLLYALFDRNEQLDRIIERACALRPEDRYGCIGELREELKALFNARVQLVRLQTGGAPPSAPQPTCPQPSAPQPTCPQPQPQLALGMQVAGKSTFINAWLGSEVQPQPQPSMPQPADTTCYVSHEVAQMPAVPASQVELRKVEFSVVAPKTLAKGDYTIIDIIMYEDAFRHIVKEKLKDMGESAQEVRSGLFKVKEGASVKIILSSPDLVLDDDTETGVWCGDYLDFSFAVLLPEEYSKNQILFIATVYIDGVIATKLKFIVKCASPFKQKISATRQDVLSAFVSYASQDRNRVAAIIQGMKKARPDMDIFFDVDSLRSGDDWERTLWTEIDERDVLFLCWSENARNSEWVDKEWRYALNSKGADFIEPVPIDPPNVCPPPEELQKKHFNDSLLYIINASEKN